MKAAFRTSYGPPEVLEVKDVPKPEPARRRGAGAGSRDHRQPNGLRRSVGRAVRVPLLHGVADALAHAPPACDFAGDVEAVGKDVTAFQVGDRVWGFDDNCAGTHAEYATFPANKAIMTIPADLYYAQAAASAEGAHYAINFLRKVPAEPGRRALVNGPTGAIGFAAVQLLKHGGVHVTAVCGTPQLALVRSLGADRVIDYLAVDFTKEDARYDFVFDAVGKSTFGACKPILDPRAASTFRPSWDRARKTCTSPLITPLLGGGKRVRFPMPVDIKGSLPRLIAELVEKGKFRPVIDRSYRIEEIRDAFTYVASGRKIGNVILTMS